MRSRWLAEGVPAYRLVNTCRQGRYRIEKTVFAHPRRDAVLQLTRFVPLVGRLDDYRLFALVSPHLGNRGGHNTAWVGRAQGRADAVRRAGGQRLALACSVPWARVIRRLHRHRFRRPSRASKPGKAGTDLRPGRGRQRGADGRGGPPRLGRPLRAGPGLRRIPAEAAHHARASLLDDLEALQ